MLDRTNIGISPLMSTPMTTSYVSSVPAQTVFQTVPQTTTFTQEAYPTTSYGAQVIDQGTTIPQTTTYTTTSFNQDPLATFTPEIATPDQTMTTFDTTNVISTQVPSTQTFQAVTAPQTSTTTSIVPNVIINQQTQVQPTPPSVAPIMDEDFQRGRPIYDEFNEDRYRGFRFGV